MNIPERSEPIKLGEALPNQDVRGVDQDVTIGFTSIFPERRPPVDFGIYPGATIGPTTMEPARSGMITGVPTN